VAGTPRLHLGKQGLETDPSKSVFINCPFDGDFTSRFDAIVFATVCCGFLPRCAFETGSIAEPRMDRITRAIFSSKYSIHDLSRCKGEGDELLARFNMPLELGIAMARRYMRTRKSERHDWLLLVPEGHQYLKFISDLAGYDPSRYDGTVRSLVQKVVSWLATRPDAVSTPTPHEVLSALPSFSAERERMGQSWGSDAPWPDIILAARRLVPR
jgi:hypothetical protein